MQTEQAALVLARLIRHGLAAVPTEKLPEEWRAVYEVVRNIPNSTGYQRAQAFTEALADDPYRFQMELELEQAYTQLEDSSLDQLRIYSAWETMFPPPVQDPCVDGLFARPSLNLLVGAPGTKKTWLALDLAVSVANDEVWLGHNASAAPVLIVDEEGGLQRTWDRLARVQRGHNASPETPVHFIPPSGFNFAERASADSLSARARSLGVGLIIVDALVNVMPGTDENNVLSVQPVLANLRRVAQETNAAIVVIHHTNKQGLFRGSTSLASGVDHMLVVESEPTSDLIELTTMKARDIEPVSITARCHFEPGAFHFSLADKSISKLGASARVLLTTLAELGTASSSQLSTAQRTSTRTRTLLHELTTAGLVIRSNPGSRGTPARYSLTPLGHSVADHKNPFTAEAFQNKSERKQAS